jgi:four helix bundle protein
MFAQRILEIEEILPKTALCNVIRDQIIRADTSIGANVEEAVLRLH